MAKSVDQWLEERELSVGDLAKRSNLAESRVDAIASGRWLASPQERKRVAEALGLTTEDILWGHVMSPRNVRYHRFGLKEDIQ